MNTRQLRVIALCFLLLAISISGFAQERKQEFYAGTLDGTTGLFKTWDAENLQRGETNFTFGYDQFNRDPGQLTIGRAVAGAAVGVVDRFEVFGSVDVRRRVSASGILPYYDQGSYLNNGAPRLARTTTGATYFTQDAPFVDIPHTNGFSDIHLGGRVNLLSERRGNPFSFAVAGTGTIPGQTDPVGLRRGLSKGTYDAGAFVLISKTAAQFIRFHGNVGMNFVGDPDNTTAMFRDELIWRGGVELPIHSSVRVIAETTGTTYVGDDTWNSVNPYRPMEVIAGIRYYPARWGAIGAGYQASFNNSASETAQAQRGGNHGFVVQGAFGTRRSEEPLTVSCSTSRNSMMQDEVAAIRANANNPKGGRLTYTWSASGGNINGNGDQADFSASAPGTYNITATVSNGKETVSCSSQITVNRRPVAPTASVEPATFSLLPGESANLRCVASDPNNSTLTYAWTVNGERLAAQGPNVTFGSEGRNPGSYDVTCTVSNGDLSASATSKGTIRERPNQAPTISCQQTATVSVASGASVELRATASDPDGDPLTFTWSSPAGAVGGNSSTTRFNAAGVRAGSYTVTVGVDDGRGGKASCNMTVNVSERIVVAKDNCGYFAANGGTRVDNCAKAILDDLAVQMRNNSSLRANVFGYTDNTRAETSRKGLGESRAKAVAAYLQERGIDSSRIQITDGGVGSFGDNGTAAGRTLNRRVEIEVAPR
ncbi:MAG: PKD domain-containing protein [Acidobacteria bacterium]|nr:PKD domain-containing protein [Acidobacteriota bacterium]